MKILFPLGIFYPATVGGPSTTLYWLTSYLKKNNVDTYIVTTDLKLDAEKHKIKINKWFCSKAGNVIYCKTKYQIFPLKALYETIKKIFIVDIVHYSSAYYYLTIYTIFLSLILRKKIILSPRGEFFKNAIDSFPKRFVIQLYKIVYTKIIFHATSDEEKKTILKLYPKAKIIIQPNFIDIKPESKILPKFRDIVFLGIIYSVKKIENVIKALAICHEFLFSDSKFLIAGKPLVDRDIIYKNKLDQLILELGLSSKIEFIGEVFGKEKENFLKDAFLLILPSESENFGNVIVEALSKSTPVIASKGTPWKILEDENAGWWIDNTPQQLSNTINEALTLTEESYLEMCINAFNLVKKKYNIDTSIDNHWINIYENILK